MVGKTEAQADAIYAAGVRQVRLQEPVQLTIHLGSTNVTNDPRTKYLPNACLIVTSFGLVTAAQTDPACVPGMLTFLMVAMADATKTTAWNTCFFRITE